MGKRSLNGKSEALMLRSQAHRTTPPEELFKKISSESGVCNVCTVAAITTLATCFYKELDTRGAILIPGIGFFWKEMVPGRAVTRKMVVGSWKECQPKPPSVNIKFVAFSELEDYLSKKNRVLAGQLPDAGEVAAPQCEAAVHGGDDSAPRVAAPDSSSDSGGLGWDR